MSKNYTTAVFSEMHKCMEANKPLPWSLGLDSIKAAATAVDSAEGQRFIEEYLLRILYIMTQQSPSKLGVNEKTIIEESILLSLKICLKLLPKHSHLLKVLGRLFDPKIPFYFGSKVGFNFTPGHPAVRLQAMRKFCDIKGFIVLANLLKSPDCIWPGAEVFVNLLAAIKSQELCNMIDDKTKESIVLSCMRLFLHLPDEQLKKESTDSLAIFFSSLGYLYFPLSAKLQGPSRHDPYYNFWFKSIIKCMHSSSIVFKLFSWEQLKELIKEAKYIRPFANSFIVEGAGTDMVNGLYTSIQRTADVDALQYSKLPTRPDLPLLTLFRCTMRNSKSKWWFLSQADLERPGTDKDIDYYLHCSSNDEEREPSCNGWTNNHSGMTLLGVSPSPVIRRGEPTMLPKGITKEMYLDYKLIEWINAEKVILLIYNPSTIHREIIIRSRLMLSFLLDYNAFQLDHLHILWIALIKSIHDFEIMDEIIITLIQLMHQMTNTLFDGFMELLQDGYEGKQQSHQQQQDESTAHYEVILLRILELLASDGCKYVTFVCQYPKITRLMSFLWKIYNEHHHDHHNNKLMTTVEELLSYCFEQKSGSKIALERIHELQGYLAHTIAHTLNTTTFQLLSTTPATTTSTLVEEEQQINKRIQTLLFLLSSKREQQHHHNQTYRHKLQSIGLEEVLVQEIHRFTLLHRHTLSTNTDVWYYHQLTSRFQVLKRYYSIVYGELKKDNNENEEFLPSFLQKQPQALYMIQSLWECVKAYPNEIDIFMMLLISTDIIPQIAPEIIAMLSKRDLLFTIYQTILCDPIINWKIAKQHTFECFKAYYTQLEGMCTLDTLTNNNDLEDIELPPSLGLDTLWNIALSIQNDDATTVVVSQAIDLLLLGYEQLNIKKLGSSNDIVDKLFQQFTTQYDHDIIQYQDELTRGLSILSRAIYKFGNGKQISHFAGGLICRIPITVYYRRFAYQYNLQTQSNMLRHDKHGDGVVYLEIHPFHSIYTLKQKIIKAAKFPKNVFITFEQGDTVLYDNSRVYELHLAKENAEVSISYQYTAGNTTSSTSKNHLPALQRNSPTMFNNSISQASASSLYEDDLYGYDRPSFHSAVDATNTSFLGSEGDEDEDEDEQFPFSNHDSYTVIGAYLIEDYSKFDYLLTLAERIASNMQQKELFTMIWDMLMTLPTQKNIQDLFFAQDYSSRESSWDHIFDLSTVSSSLCRITYTLQMMDMLLQPAEEMIMLKSHQSTFLSQFLQSSGLSVILDIILAIDTSSTSSNNTDENDNSIQFAVLAVALHILYYLLLGNEVSMSKSQQAFFIHLQQSEEKAIAMLDRLLFVTRRAAAREDSSVVHNALAIITVLVRSPVVAAHFIGNEDSKTLLIHVLRSQAKKVRETASEVAIHIGRAQPIVFTWLAQAFQTIDFADNHCWELITAVKVLLQEYYNRVQQDEYAASEDFLSQDILQLCDFLTKQLFYYPEYAQSGIIPRSVGADQERYILLGYLELINLYLQYLPERVLSSKFGNQLVHAFFTKYLFATSVHSAASSTSSSSSPPLVADHQLDALCDTTKTRQTAYQILSSVVKYSPTTFEQIIDELSVLVSKASKHMHHSWGLQVTHDMKKPNIQHTGLKNQGCTCYLNSCLQTLFMLPSFRNAVFATPIRECHRNTLWHRNDIDLVGEEILFEWINGNWRMGKVIGYDEELSMHRIQYYKQDSITLDEVVILNIHEGRPQRETGRVKILPKDGEESIGEPLTPQEQDAYHVLEELQRTFCFLHLSKKRYFDPRPFVDACKSLNLNFNVYHQNDAVEFYDQLLDRIEIATKGKHTKKDMWNEMFMKDIFGGKWLNQKIPTDCEHFQQNKNTCGHWQSARMENYLKVEIMIRGKEKVEDSLEGLVQGELFDGDNKLSCDVCNEKKAAIRRTCFGSIPETLILHLKRFDLDYQTFETVKLNSKMAFANRINILKYTKEGIEITEAEGKEGSTLLPRDKQGRIELEYQDDASNKKTTTIIDPEDYEYELQGILVHAGIAQGGHYYSYIRANSSDSASSSSSSSSEEETPKWYRFDDDEVTPFDPEQIATECYGGSSGLHGQHEDDRTANALMLLYTKVKKSEQSLAVTTSNNQQAEEYTDLVDGLKAFQREVNESNLQHMLTCFLIDPELHSFVRGLISSIYSTTASSLATTLTSLPSPGTTASLNATNVFQLQWSPGDQSVEDLPLRTVQFGCRFLLDVVLHCRERPAVRTFIHIMKGAFESYPHTAMWFLNQIVAGNTAVSWANEYLLNATDVLARGSFVQLFVHAVSAIAPTTVNAITAVPSQEFRKDIPVFTDPAALCARISRYTLDLTFKAVNYTRNADEIFMLVRDLAGIPSMGYAYRALNMISFLSFYVTPEYLPPTMRNFFEKQMITNNNKQNVRVDYTHLLPSVFEAIAAILGIPPSRKINLLQETSHWETDLVPEAKDAFTIIFQECVKPGSGGGGMDLLDITRYLDRVTGTTTTQKSTTLSARNMLDRFGAHHGEHKLYLEGFLRHQADVASYNPKICLHLDFVMICLELPQQQQQHTAAAAATTRSSVVVEDLDDDTVDENEPPSQSQVASKRVKTNGTSSATAMAIINNTADPVITLADLTDNCRNCLLNIQFYETGLNMSTAADQTVKAIAEKICFNNFEASEHLLNQALSRLYTIITDNSWNNNAINLIIDFIKLIVILPDQKLHSDWLGKRLKVVLFANHVGYAIVLAQERERPTVCRSNEFNRTNVSERYAGLIQEVATFPGCITVIKQLAKEDQDMKVIKGMLRLKPGISLTENEYREVKHTILIVENAGNHELNGEYIYTNIKQNAGYYSRIGKYNNAIVRFTLYKCTLRNGGFQWFLSITPDGLEPGTSSDTDFYFAPAKPSDILPTIGSSWCKISGPHVRDPVPRIRKIRTPINEDSDSEDEDEVQQDEVQGEGEDDSDLDSIRVHVNTNTNNSTGDGRNGEVYLEELDSLDGDENSIVDILMDDDEDL